MSGNFPELPRPKQHSFDRILKDMENPMSVINLVPNDVVKSILAIPKDLLDLDEEALELKIPEQTATVNQLREFFWREYDRAIELRMRMDMARVYVGICTREAFNKICHDPMKLAWIVTPPKEYTAVVDELLTVALKQVRAILKLPLINSMGFTDVKLADVQLKAAMMLDMRQKGGYIMRSMQINQNLNTNETKISISHDGSESALDVDERIKMLEAEISKHEHKVTEQIEATIEQKHAVKPVTIEAEFKEV